MATTKITAKIYKPLWLSFNKQAKGLFIKSSAFLNHVIERETPHLSRELEGKRLSLRAKRHIAGALKMMGADHLHPINIVVDQATAAALDEVVKRSNLVRDAFINRLIMLLRSSDALLAHFDIPKTVDARALRSAEPMPTSPMKAMEAVRDDPLFYLRLFAEKHLESGLYLLPLPDQLFGFSCYVDDEHVPGTVAHGKAKANLNDLVAALESFESKAFASARKTVK